MLNDFFKKERIGLNIIKEINKKDKRLRVYDLFYQDKKTTDKIDRLLSSNNYSVKKASQVGKILLRVVKKFIDIKSFLPTTRYSIKNLNEIRKYLLKIKKILIGIDPDEIFQEDYFDERMFKYKVKLFEPYKSIGGQYDVWLDFIEQMIKSIDSENRKKYIPSKISEVEYFVCLAAFKLEHLDKSLKPSQYYNDYTNNLNLVGELIFIVANFYDKRITKRTIKDALKKYPKFKKEIGQMDFLYKLSSSY